jgi:raffinose/stachyose/melibiose transport system substrate-binding protein
MRAIALGTTTGNSSISNSVYAVLAATALSCMTPLSGAGAQTLTVWDDYTPPPQTEIITKLNAQFEAAHPGVKIERTGRSFDDLILTLKLTLASGGGPVVSKANQGAQEMGAMAKQKQLLPVDAYIAKYGWDKRQSESVLARDRWSEQGEFGLGPTYGISSLGEMVGLFYNAKVLREAGIEKPPTTMEEFVKDVEALKTKGSIALMLGTAKGNMALHMFAALSQAAIGSSDRKTLDDLIYGRGGKWNTPGNLAAAKQLQEWAASGAFLDGYQGVADDDAVQLFASGQGGFLITGTWRLGDLQANPDIHFMAVPGFSGTLHPLVVGGVDLAWTITANAKDKATQDLAGEYLNYMVSDEAAAAWATAGYLPSVAVGNSDHVNVPALLGETITVWNDANAGNALGHYPDWASPTMLKTVQDNLANLLAGNQTPDDFVSALDKDYQSYLATLK